MLNEKFCSFFETNIVFLEVCGTASPETRINYSILIGILFEFTAIL